LTVGWLLNRWLEDRVSTLEAQTPCRYRSLVRVYFMPAFGNWRLRDLRAIAVHDYLASATSAGHPLVHHAQLHIY
jgi:hypothetical protein